MKKKTIFDASKEEAMLAAQKGVNVKRKKCSILDLSPQELNTLARSATKKAILGHISTGILIFDNGQLVNNPVIKNLGLEPPVRINLFDMPELCGFETYEQVLVLLGKGVFEVDGNKAVFDPNDKILSDDYFAEFEIYDTSENFQYFVEWGYAKACFDMSEEDRERFYIDENKFSGWRELCDRIPLTESEIEIIDQWMALTDEEQAEKIAIAKTFEEVKAELDRKYFNKHAQTKGES